MKLLLARLRAIQEGLPFWQQVTTDRAQDALAAALLHDVGHGPLDACQLLVVVPALIRVGLGQECQLGRPLRVGSLEDRETGLVGDEGGDRDRGRRYWRFRKQSRC